MFEPNGVNWSYDFTLADNATVFEPNGTVWAYNELNNTLPEARGIAGRTAPSEVSLLPVAYGDGVLMQIFDDGSVLQVLDNGSMLAFDPAIGYLSSTTAAAGSVS